MPASPNIGNLSILKGIIKFTPTGGVQRDLGEAPEVELTPAIEKLDYNSNRSGVRTKVKSVVLEKSMTLRVVLSEINAENLQMMLIGGEIITNTDGSKSFDIFENSDITGVIEFTGTNDVGSQVDMILPNVSFGPSGSLNVISDEWGQLEFEGEVLASTNTDGSTNFGTVTVRDEA